MYKFRCRPGYKSDKLLIEFTKGVEKDSFFTDLLKALSKIEMKVDSVDDLWMNDEFLINIKSKIGEFFFSKDIWDFAFIMSETNQEAIKKICYILSKNKYFIKEEVNFDDYK